MKSLKLDSAEFMPSKIVCIGRNYLEHIRELGSEMPTQMVIFCKPNSSISDDLVATSDGESLHFEGEICFVVRDGCLRGVGFGLDLTRRELQSTLKKKGLPWERSKAFDGAACFSDFVSLGDTDITSLALQLEINGELRQDGGYDLMIHKPDAILAEVQQFMSLEDGDVIMSGTPSGVGNVAPGDRFTARVVAGERVLVEHEWIAK